MLRRIVNENMGIIIIWVWTLKIWSSLLSQSPDGPCLDMPCPWIAITGQSNLTWSNLEQLAHNDASWSEMGASLSEL